MLIFWVKITILGDLAKKIFISLFKNIFFLQFNDIFGNKKQNDKNIFPSSFDTVFDPEWIKIRIRDKHPGPATLDTIRFNIYIKVPV